MYILERCASVFVSGWRVRFIFCSASPAYERPYFLSRLMAFLKMVYSANFKGGADENDIKDLLHIV